MCGLYIYICMEMKWSEEKKLRKGEWEREKKWERKKGEREKERRERKRKKREKEKEKNRERKFRAKIQRDPSPLQILLVCSSINKVRGEWGQALIY